MNGQDVNIPYGTELITNDTGDVLLWQGQQLCYTRSQNARDYFSRNDDGCGEERGKLVAEIQALLKKQDAKHQARWDRIWDNPTCNRLRNPEHEDYWVWDIGFYEAAILDLRHIKSLIQY